MDTASIYVLVDPRDGEVRYVGWTTKTLAWRLLRHVKARGKTWRDNWIAVLLGLGEIPIIRVLQVLPLQGSQDAERYWIKTLRDAGCRLTNTTEGGEGVVGYTWTAEARVAVSQARQGRVTTDVTRAKISAAAQRQMADPRQRAAVSRVHKGKQISAAQRKKVGEAATLRWAAWRSAGNTMSVEAREKLSAAKRGKPGHPLSAATREKIAVSKRGKPRSLETRAKISASHRGKRAA